MERPRAQVQVGVTAAGGAAQGSVLGYGLGVMNKSLEAQAANMPNKPPMAAQGSFSGPPKVLALNLAVFSAVQGGLTLAIKKYRGGVEDIQGSMMAMFGSRGGVELGQRGDRVHDRGDGWRGAQGCGWCGDGCGENGRVVCVVERGVHEGWTNV